MIQLSFPRSKIGYNRRGFREKRRIRITCTVDSAAFDGGANQDISN